MVCFLGNDFIPAIPNEKHQVLSTSKTDAEVYHVVYNNVPVCSLLACWLACMAFSEDIPIALQMYAEQDQN